MMKRGGMIGTACNHAGEKRRKGAGLVSLRLSLALGLVGLGLSGCITPPFPGQSGPGNPDVAGQPYPTGSPLDLSGCDRLVVIEANDTAAGIAKEDAYIERTYPGARKVRQSLKECGSGKVDVISIQTPDGAMVDIWFDISSFFGKVRGRDLDDLLDG